MIKISDFTPSVSRHHSQCNTANCKVVINNSGQPSEGPTPLFNQSQLPLDQSGSSSNLIRTRSVTIETGDSLQKVEDPDIQPSAAQPELPARTTYPTVATAEQPDPYVSLYKHLAITFANILKTINAKLLANIIDPSGKVVMDADSLVTAIGLLVNTDPRNIKISYEDPDVGCVGKVNPIKIIASIKVNGYDFSLAYNKLYNILEEEFHVSLTRTLIM